MDLQRCISLVKDIEGLLEAGLGATGKGLHEKATSVEKHLDERQLRRLRYIATLRNKLVHESEFNVDQLPDDFEDTCRQLVAELRQLQPQQKRPSQVQTVSTISKDAQPVSPADTQVRKILRRREPLAERQLRDSSPPPRHISRPLPVGEYWQTSTSRLQNPFEGFHSASKIELVKRTLPKGFSARIIFPRLEGKAVAADLPLHQADEAPSSFGVSVRDLTLALGMSSSELSVEMADLGVSIADGFVASEDVGRLLDRLKLKPMKKEE